jgi:hypothetical protein
MGVHPACYLTKLILDWRLGLRAHFELFFEARHIPVQVFHILNATIRIYAQLGELIGVRLKFTQSVLLIAGTGCNQF